MRGEAKLEKEWGPRSDLERPSHRAHPLSHTPQTHALRRGSRRWRSRRRGSRRGHRGTVVFDGQSQSVRVGAPEDPHGSGSAMFVGVGDALLNGSEHGPEDVRPLLCESFDVDLNDQARKGAYEGLQSFIQTNFRRHPPQNGAGLSGESIEGPSRPIQMFPGAVIAATVVFLGGAA